jgi:chemotaxis protein histidine kinase CheA
MDTLSTGKKVEAQVVGQFLQDSGHLIFAVKQTLSPLECSPRSRAMLNKIHDFLIELGDESEILNADKLVELSSELKSYISRLQTNKVQTQSQSYRLLVRFNDELTKAVNAVREEDYL